MACQIEAIVNQKGGVGKTTTALNLSAALAAKDKRVLAIDLDPQGHLTSALFKEPFEKTIFHVFNGDEKYIKNVITKGKGFDLVPADIELSGVELKTDLNSYFILREQLRTIREHYDYILLDCPPALNLFMVNAAMAANAVIITVQTEFLALKGFRHLLQTLGRLTSHNPNLENTSVLFTMVDMRRKIDQSVIALIETEKVNRFNSIIRQSVELAESPIRFQSVMEYAPQSRGANDYAALADEIIKR